MCFGLSMMVTAVDAQFFEAHKFLTKFQRNHIVLAGFIYICVAYWIEYFTSHSVVYTFEVSFTEASIFVNDRFGFLVFYFDVEVY